MINPCSISKAILPNKLPLLLVLNAIFYFKKAGKLHKILLSSLRFTTFKKSTYSGDFSDLSKRLALYNITDFHNMFSFCLRVINI